MSLRDPGHQIELEMTEPVPPPATIVRIWLDDAGKVQSERVWRDTGEPITRAFRALRAGRK